MRTTAHSPQPPACGLSLALQAPLPAHHNEGKTSTCHSHDVICMRSSDDIIIICEPPEPSLLLELGYSAAPQQLQRGLEPGSGASKAGTAPEGEPGAAGLAWQQDVCPGSWMCSAMMPEQRAGAECPYPGMELRSRPGSHTRCGRAGKPPQETSIGGCCAS